MSEFILKKKTVLQILYLFITSTNIDSCLIRLCKAIN